MRRSLWKNLFWRARSLILILTLMCIGLTMPWNILNKQGYITTIITKFSHLPYTFWPKKVFFFTYLPILVDSSCIISSVNPEASMTRKRKKHKCHKLSHPTSGYVFSSLYRIHISLQSASLWWHLLSLNVLIN